jgi:hypothetical protein
VLQCVNCAVVGSPPWFSERCVPDCEELKLSLDPYEQGTICISVADLYYQLPAIKRANWFRNYNVLLPCLFDFILMMLVSSLLRQCYQNKIIVGSLTICTIYFVRLCLFLGFVDEDPPPPTHTHPQPPSGSSDFEVIDFELLILGSK